ncbi:hypothetical protein D0T51_03065 [Parabacteroides sp. 52]|uniref:hypothetical protein n=1 Tax=unclassified Parabacteroides TaxID=2649774 RepID=UPI0013D65596|nr:MULTISPECIES: hypothetical protein [unclassified Parabacteroides]MDH6533974.1 hypothetical protein [Parabacteroides sp. PM5-20]NDV54715.1 hypothetical protein [Parabacteroides sp. 52]
MLKMNRGVVIISILIVAQLSVWAQNNTNSPYSRFGYGELANRSFAAGRAMGGIGYGLRSSKQINPMNPASYTSMDSLTFLFDFGAQAQMSWYDDGTNKQRYTNGNVEYMAMQFPLHKRIAMSVGLLPYSFVGYEFGGYKDEGDQPYSETFVGTGGLNELYAGLSIDIWKKRLSVGANIGYLFGNIDHEQNAVFYSADAEADNSYRKQRIEVRDMKMDFGIQYTHPLSRTNRLVFGAVYSPAKKLHTKSYDIFHLGSSSSAGTTTTDTISNQRFDLPSSFGLGASFVKDNKLTIGADVMYEAWEKAYFFDKKSNFDNRFRVAAGVEYIPNQTSRKYLQNIKYRAGAHYGNSYVNVNMKEGGVSKKYGYDEYGVSVGFGLPIKMGMQLHDNRSYINLSIEYVKVSPAIRTMIDEQYLRFAINYTFNELWFLKQKVD